MLPKSSFCEYLCQMQSNYGLWHIHREIPSGAPTAAIPAARTAGSGKNEARGRAPELNDWACLGDQVENSDLKKHNSRAKVMS